MTARGSPSWLNQRDAVARIVGTHRSAGRPCFLPVNVQLGAEYGRPVDGRALPLEGWYGAFAYALAIVMLGETIVLFGLDHAVSRLMPISLEKRDYATAFGVLVVSVVAVLSLGALLTVAVVFSRGAFEGSVIGDHRAVTLLALMIVLAPIQALEDLFVGIFSVLGRPRTIFVRTYVIAPALRLGGGRGPDRDAQQRLLPGRRIRVDGRGGPCHLARPSRRDPQARGSAPVLEPETAPASVPGDVRVHAAVALHRPRQRSSLLV